MYVTFSIVTPNPLSRTGYNANFCGGCGTIGTLCTILKFRNVNG